MRTLWQVGEFPAVLSNLYTLYTVKKSLHIEIHIELWRLITAKSNPFAKIFLLELFFFFVDSALITQGQ